MQGGIDMIIKLIFIVGIIFLYFVLKIVGREQLYFYLTVIMLSVRVLAIPIVGELTPATVMIATMFIGTLPRLGILRVQNIPFVFTIILALCIGLLNTYFGNTRVFKWGLLLFNVLALSELTRLFVVTRQDIIRLTWCIVATCLVFSVATIIGYYGLGDGTVIYNGVAAYEDGIDSLHSSRTYGITSSNLVQCISVITICLVPLLNIQNKKYEYLIIAIFCFAGLITIKRMTFIAMVISLLFYIKQQINARNFKQVSIVTALCSCLILFWWDALVYRFGIAGIGGLGQISDHSTMSRFSRIGFAIDAFNRSPIFGMGSGYVTYVHNGFFEILGNCGILGVTIVFWRFIPNVRDIISGNPWAVAAIIYIITCFSLESSINHAQIIYFLGLYLGGYMANGVDADENDNDDESYICSNSVK